MPVYNINTIWPKTGPWGTPTSKYFSKEPFNVCILQKLPGSKTLSWDILTSNNFSNEHNLKSSNQYPYIIKIVEGRRPKLEVIQPLNTLLRSPSIPISNTNSKLRNIKPWGHPASKYFSKNPIYKKKCSWSTKISAIDRFIETYVLKYTLGTIYLLNSSFKKLLKTKKKKKLLHHAHNFFFLSLTPEVLTFL